MEHEIKAGISLNSAQEQDVITAMAKMLNVWAACSWGLLACKDCTLPCSLHVVTSTCDKSLGPCVTNLCSPNAFPLQTPWGKQEVYRRTDSLRGNYFTNVVEDFVLKVRDD